MSEYDDYLTNEDKPFAENLNDALLVSNVYDFTVPIQIPSMFHNKQWLTEVLNKKCGVAIVGLKEGLDGIHSATIDGNDVLTGSGTIKLSFYPNFNSFGGITSIEWENIGSGTVKVDIYDSEGRSILQDINNGLIVDQPVALRQLQRFELRITLTNATLKTLKVTMKNKDKERYGADLSNNYVVNKLISVFEDLISLGSGTLYDRIETLVNQSFYLKSEIASFLNGKVDKVEGKVLSTNDYSTAEKTKLDSVEDNANNYIHPNYITKSKKLYKVSVDSTGHVNDVTEVTKSDITGLGIPGANTDTTYGADRGVSLSNGNFGHSNYAIAPQGTAALKKIEYDEYGHIVNAQNIVASDLPSHSHTKTDITNFKKEIVDIIYPVGAIYISMNATNPATLFGGTWTQLKDRFLIGAGESYSAGVTGGEAAHTLTQNEMPTHAHWQDGHTHQPWSGKFLVSENNIMINNTARHFPAAGDTWQFLVYSNDHGGIEEYGDVKWAQPTIHDNGGGASHNNMPPYLPVYMWQRIS